jgi:hypothetical protein
MLGFSYEVMRAVEQLNVTTAGTLQQLQTYQGSIVFLDIDSGELRHGQAESSPNNVFFVLREGVGHLLAHAPDAGGLREIHVVPGLAPTPVQFPDRASGTAQAWSLVPAEGGAVGLCSDSLFLCAGRNGIVTLSRKKCDLWERFSFLGDQLINDDNLPNELEYTGEFGPELVIFLPFCLWLSKIGLMRDRKIRTYRGMTCFYDDIGCLEIIEKDQKRNSVPAHKRPFWLPVRNEHDFDDRGRPAQHFYPDLRGKFLKYPMSSELEAAQRPILVIHNKHNAEWGPGPVNHISIETLDIIFGTLKADFTIVYIRHGMGATQEGYVEDHSAPKLFEDRPLLGRHPEILCFDDLYAAHLAQGGTQDINTFKNVIYSRCYRFISSQGGGAHQIALFSGSLLAVLHRKGEEEYWAYGDGYYGFMAAVPPIRAICRTEDDLKSALPLFVNSAMAEDRLLLSAGSERLLAKFSPWTIAQRP